MPVSNCIFNLAICIDSSGDTQIDGIFEFEKYLAVQYNNNVTFTSQEKFIDTMVNGFATYVENYVPYGNYATTEEVNGAIMDASPLKDSAGTQIGGCMHDVYTRSAGNLPIVVFILIDGDPNGDSYNLTEISWLMRENSFMIQAGGFSSVSSDILTDITGDPDLFVYGTKVQELDFLIDYLTNDICELRFWI
ncbi:hypothetical protein MHBO_001925 [Bonamia ostreae]|uniref:VWFA domain-containing protein n=1 Tax=Bonamia ostreae TaxID=126728 RepID=A0ABV2AKP3_9EUKA